jgi:NitT/TauT family transport system substrate-binding protein
MNINLKLGRFLLLFPVVGVVSLVLNPYASLYAQTNLSDEPVRISVHSLWPPNALAYLAEEKGLFEKNGVNVELSSYPDYREVVESYALGEADGLTLVFSDVILQNAAGVETRVVYILDDSQFGDAIISKAKNLTELKGKKIGVEGISSFSHLFTLRALEKVGLSEADVQFVDIPAANTSRAIEKGEIDAGHTYSPFIDAATAKGYNVLITANENPGIITDVLAFRPNILEERPADIENIIKSYSEALSFYNKNTNEAVDIMSSKSGISKEEIIRGFNGTKLISLQDNVLVSMKNDPKNRSSLFASGDYISKFYIDRGVMSEYPILDEIIVSKFANDLYKKILSISN